MPSSTLLSSRSIPLGGGPPSSFPSAAKKPLWHGHRKLSFSARQATEHPRCGHTDESTPSCPFASLITYTAFSEMTFRQPSRCSTVISFLTGEATKANSSTLPTSDHDRGVVTLSSG